MHKLNNLFKKYIPKNHSCQVAPEYFVDCVFQKNKTKKILDLGCGTGESLDYFKKKNPDIEWIGLDIAKSPEVGKRTRKDIKFYNFDGINIPFKNNYFDLIFCKQVLEHVQEPSSLLKEICRVLKPEGFFIGSTSYLEPYHSYSLQNYTPYGFYLLLKNAGLKLEEIRSGIDGLTLLIRRGLGRPKIFDKWRKKESPLNRFISLAGKLMRKDHVWINSIKLLFAGQFCFFVRK